MYKCTCTCTFTSLSLPPSLPASLPSSLYLSLFPFAKVVNIEELVRPVLDQLLHEAVEEARGKAREETMSRLIAVQQAVQAHQGACNVHVHTQSCTCDHHPVACVTVKTEILC